MLKQRSSPGATHTEVFIFWHGTKKFKVLRRWCVLPFAELVGFLQTWNVPENQELRHCGKKYELFLQPKFSLKFFFCCPQNAYIKLTHAFPSLFYEVGKLIIFCVSVRINCLKNLIVKNARNFLRQEIKKKIDWRTERGRLAKINFRQQWEIDQERSLRKIDISKLLVKCPLGER